MKVPYFPLYIADYDSKTAHLTLEEDGAYLRLLRLCWRTPGLVQSRSIISDQSHQGVGRKSPSQVFSYQSGWSVRSLLSQAVWLATRSRMT